MTATYKPIMVDMATIVIRGRNTLLSIKKMGRITLQLKLARVTRELFIKKVLETIIVFTVENAIQIVWK